MNATHYGQQPEEEEKRLKELRRYDILDSLTEKDYDDITTLASIICDVPIALVSFIDKDRQWFKASHGLQAGETHRQHSFCSHAILTPHEPFIVEDSRLDERFKDNPYVTGNPNIVFYAGIPLISSNGYGLGSFCVVDNKPRVLTPDQLKALKILASQVMNLLEMRKANVDLNIRGEMLEIKNKKLDTIIAERISETEKQKTQLEKANKELQAFNYIASHDLQEPLRKIQIFSSLIKERELHKLSETGQEYISKIAKASARMSHLIKDLLVYSRNATENKAFEPILLSNAVKDILQDMHEEIEQKGAKITLNGDAEFNAIGFQFRQVMFNLLSNALKFSRPGVPPEITIGYKFATTAVSHSNKPLQEQQHHELTFTDNGIGFESQFNDKVFELFQRLETKDQHSGTGIGLAIVKKIIDNHNGKIEVESTPGMGTTFRILLPLN